MIVAALKFMFNYGNCQQRIYHAAAGEGLPRHNHPSAHAFYCAAGSCVVRMDHKERVLTAGDHPIKLPPVEFHEIEALENGTVFINTFDMREPQ